MAYTLDYATATNIAFTFPRTFFDDNTFGVICGWWYPLALNGNQTLYNAGTAVHMARCDSVTTTTLEIYIDTTSTNGYDHAAGALSTNKWLFIGIGFRIWDQGAGNCEMDTAVFVGDVNNPPARVTSSTITSASGTVVNGTAGYVGDPTANEGWEGGAADISFFSSITASNLNKVYGANPTTEGFSAVAVLNEYLMPIWRGQWDQAWHPSKRGNIGVDGFMLNLPLKTGARSVGLVGTTLNGNTTINGATVSSGVDNPRSYVRDLYPPLPNRANKRMR